MAATPWSGDHSWGESPPLGLRDLPKVSLGRDHHTLAGSGLPLHSLATE